MAYQLPTLPYAFDALEPYIDTTTMQIHHGKHHAAYVANLNKAIDGTPFESVPLDQLLAKLDTVPENIRTVVRNNGGGHLNHSLFWTILAPNAVGAGADRRAGCRDRQGVRHLRRLPRRS